MFFANIFNAEIVDNKRELYWSSFVIPKAKYKLALMVAALVEATLEDNYGVTTDGMAKDILALL